MAALLAAMAYVDLNPVRAGIAETPEASDHTSIQQRLGRAPPAVESMPQDAAPEPGLDNTQTTGHKREPLPRAPLMPFDATGQTPWVIPFGWQDQGNAEQVPRALRIPACGDLRRCKCSRAAAIAALRVLHPIPMQGAPHHGDLFSVARAELVDWTAARCASTSAA